MPVSAISLLNNIGLASPKIQKIIPNYSILFWHHTEKWNDVNSSISYGNDPSNYNDPLRIFRQYDIGQSSIPDVAGFYSNSKSTLSFNYLVRCVSSNTAWPSICDIKYDANTNMKTTQATLLDVGGAHNYTLVGRTSPPLKNSVGTPLIPNIPVSYYNIAHSGHLHQVEGLYNFITSVDPGATDCILLNDQAGSHVPKSFSSFFVDPIIKDPSLLNIPVAAIPKDIIVMYYGNSTLSLDHYDPYDLSMSGDNNNIDYSANSYALPLTFVQTSTYLEAGKVGAKNLIIAATDLNSLLTEQRILAGLQSQVNVVGINTPNTITFVASSNTAGWHDHAPLAKQSSKLISSNPAVTYNVITKPNGGIVYPNNFGEKYPDGPDPINHKHNVTYTSELKLKSVKLKAFLSKTSYAPITKGLIIGYSIGKYSKYSGISTDGSNSLPPGWYFCDGQNGTPDLRGKYPFLDFTQGTDDSSTINPTKSSILIKQINVETINWQHGHVSGTSTLPGSAGSMDVGSHASNYDPISNPNNTTRHNHPVSGQVTFSQANPSGLGSTIQTNAIVGTSFDYEPPTVEIAFIMYNDTI